MNISCVIALCDNKTLYKQPLLPLLDGGQMPVCFNQQANGLVVSQVGMCATLSAVCSTPPQVDTSTYKNSSSRIRKGKARALAFLALLRRFATFASKSAQFVSDIKSVGVAAPLARVAWDHDARKGRRYIQLPYALFSRISYDNARRNDGNANSGKNKPDKSKSKPDKQGGREQQDRKKPKTKG